MTRLPLLIETSPFHLPWLRIAFGGPLVSITETYVESYLNICDRSSTNYLQKSIART
jgi:hypothetical protein